MSKTGGANLPGQLLPRPIVDERPDWLTLYDKAWEIASAGVKRGTADNGFVGEYLDEGFSDHIFQWDTCHMMLFAKYASGFVPSIVSLDNFYRSQHSDGAICRELRESDGSDHWSRNSLDYTNPPLFSWAEWEYYRLTGDGGRFGRVLPALDRYFRWCRENRTREDGMYYWNNLASGMDNLPRPENENVGWVDYTAQQAMAARYMSRMAAVIGYRKLEARYVEEYATLSALVNELCWNEEDGYYYDVYEDGGHAKIKTAASFWTMLAGVASPEQAARLAEHLTDPAEFHRPHLFPALSADHAAYSESGDYWNGGVWAPTNVMYVKGLQEAGYEELATRAAINHLDNMAEVFREVEPHTIWENYSPELATPGEPARPDFVGWSGNGPITLLVENIIGLRADGVDSTITWLPTLTGRHGLENLRFGKHSADLVALPGDSAEASLRIEVRAEAPFTLEVVHRGRSHSYDVGAGETRLTVP